MAYDPEKSEEEIDGSMEDFSETFHGIPAQEYITLEQLKEESQPGFEEGEGRKRNDSDGKKGDDKKAETINSMIMFSVAVVAVVGAIIAIARKLRER